VAASGKHSYYNSASWINGQYEPVPLIRWDFTDLAPGEIVEAMCQLRFRIRREYSGTSFNWEARAVSALVANTVFPQYQLGGIAEDEDEIFGESD